MENKINLTRFTACLLRYGLLGVGVITFGMCIIADKIPYSYGGPFIAFLIGCALGHFLE